MSKLIAKIFATLSAVGFLNSAAIAASFNSVGEARAYLVQHPTGPRAEEAFKLIVEASLSKKYPGFAPQSSSYGSSPAIFPSSGVSREAIIRGFAELSGRDTAAANNDQQVY